MQLEYLVLARKFRPQTFEDVAGQEHVVKTLSNAIGKGRVAHAFLFSGPRGVGKTLLNHEWVTLPKYNPPDVDSTDIDPKYEARAFDIDKLADIADSEDLDPTESEEYYKKAYNLKIKIMKARSAGLSESGEFSIENLVFKKIRSEGKLKKLIDTIVKFYDKIYTQ